MAVVVAPAMTRTAHSSGRRPRHYGHCRAVVKLSVYRSEKRNEEGELVAEKGWKAIGKGQLRLMCSEGVHFVEFRPEVSEGSNNQDPEEEMSGKTRFGRPVLSATLRADTKFDRTKNKVQVNLRSLDAAGSAIYARYNMSLPSETTAESFVQLASASLPPA